MAPDIVFVLGVQQEYEELRYCLRSIETNLPETRVWIAGAKPHWIKNVEHIYTRNDLGTKYQNSTHNLLRACLHPEVSEKVWFFNDDHFILKPMKTIPLYHRGFVKDVEEYYQDKYNGKPEGTYVTGMRLTRLALEEMGIKAPKSYEVHAPMPIRKSEMVEALHKGMDLKIVAFHKRTFYGNLFPRPAKFVEDVKVLAPDEGVADGSVLISTSDRFFKRGAAGRMLRTLFPVPSRFEKV